MKDLKTLVALGSLVDSKRDHRVSIHESPRDCFFLSGFKHFITLCYMVDAFIYNVGGILLG